MTIATGEKMYAADILNLTFFPKGTILTFSSTAWGATSAEFKNIWKVCNAANNAVDNFIPDLTNKFLRGAESSGTDGGADSQSVTIQTTHLPSHNHGASGLSISGMSLAGLSCGEGGSHEHALSGKKASDGSHSHSVTDPGHAHTTPWATGWPKGGGAKGGAEYSGTTSTGDAKTGISITSTNSAHSHSFSPDSKAVSAPAHKHIITGSITGGTISGSITNTGSGAPLSINTVPVYYTVIYIIKIV